VILFHSVQGMKLDEHLFFSDQKISGTCEVFFLPCIYVVPISTKSQSLISTKSQYQIDKKCYQYTKIVFYS